MPDGRPPAEVEVTEGLIRDLLAEQHPELSGLRVSFLDQGWNNFTFRLGDEYAVRIPRRALDVDLILAEQRWLPLLAAGLSLRVPVPLKVGAPSDLFPWPWSIVPWIEGQPVDLTELNPAQAVRLADFLLQLHGTAPPEAPSNPFRGVPLRSRQSAVQERLTKLRMPDLEALWKKALKAPQANSRKWLHGDLHPKNLLAADGILTGVIDWGDLTAGDIATDLACAWLIFDTPSQRNRFFSAYAPSRAALTRASGWAVNFASILLASGDPRHVKIGQAARRRLASDLGRSNDRGA